MMRIIAIGSPFNDDTIAWRCLEAMETPLKQFSADIDIRYCGSPGTQLIHLLEPQLDTVLVDAFLTENADGHVQAIEAEDLQRPQALSSHEISVAHVLQLARNLHSLPDRLYILGIGVNPHRTLSSTQAEQVQQQLMQRLQALAPRPTAP